MYEVVVSNYVNTLDKSWKFLEWTEACDVFVSAGKSEDCEYALLLNAVTGELYAEYEDGAITIYNLPEDDKMAE